MQSILFTTYLQQNYHQKHWTCLIVHPNYDTKTYKYNILNNIWYQCLMLNEQMDPMVLVITVCQNILQNCHCTYLYSTISISQDLEFAVVATNLHKIECKLQTQIWVPNTQHKHTRTWCKDKPKKQQKNPKATKQTKHHKTNTIQHHKTNIKQQTKHHITKQTNHPKTKGNTNTRVHCARIKKNNRKNKTKQNKQNKTKQKTRQNTTKQKATKQNT